LTELGRHVKGEWYCTLFYVMPFSFLPFCSFTGLPRNVRSELFALPDRVHPPRERAQDGARTRQGRDLTELGRHVKGEWYCTLFYVMPFSFLPFCSFTGLACAIRSRSRPHRLRSTPSQRPLRAVRTPRSSAPASRRRFARSPSHPHVHAPTGHAAFLPLRRAHDHSPRD
jgi:hypothetical protein